MRTRFFDGMVIGISFPVGNAEMAPGGSGGTGRSGAVASGAAARLLRHVSTADTARDLDLLRRAVGDRRLSYYGFSYGTFLGATYANLFPDHVRAMVLDSNLEPRAYVRPQIKANGGRFLTTELRVRSDQSAARTLNAFLDLLRGGHRPLRVLRRQPRRHAGEIRGPPAAASDALQRAPR